MAWQEGHPEHHERNVAQHMSCGGVQLVAYGAVREEEGKAQCIIDKMKGIVMHH